MSHYTQPRATKDLDLLIKPDADNAKAVYAALAQFGAPLEFLSVADFANRSKSAKRQKNGRPGRMKNNASEFSTLACYLPQQQRLLLHRSHSPVERH